MAVASEENVDDASIWLADLATWLEALEQELDDHLGKLGIQTPTSFDAETKALAESLRLQRWFSFTSVAKCAEPTLRGRESGGEPRPHNLRV
jgi:hypothetical protein